MHQDDSSLLSPRAALVHRLAAAHGFALVGIAPAQASEHEAQLRAWLSAGKQGEMDYLARNAELMVDPQRVLPGAQSIICLADRYVDNTADAGAGRPDLKSDRSNLRSEISNHSRPPASGHHTPSPTPHTPPPLGRIARYARGDDYHRVMKDRLHAMADGLRAAFEDEQFRCTVDTAPLAEREHAGRAGLGWIGKHTLVIHPRLGSYLLLGEILTTLRIETSAEAGYPALTVPSTDRCGTCTRCIDACPTQCITPYSVDASRCISYLTIEHRGPIDEAFHPLMRDWIAGCDVCQEVCPYNQKKADGETPFLEIPNLKSQAPDNESEMSNVKSQSSGKASDVPNVPTVHPAYASRLPALPLLEVLEWSEADRRAALIRSPLKRIKLAMFKRNALIAAGNALLRADHPGLMQRIHAIAGDESETELVRLTARQQLDRRRGASARIPV